MHDDRRDLASRELLGAIVELIAGWTAADTQEVIAREIGLEIAEGDVRALHTIGQRPGGVRPAELASFLRLSRPTTSKAIARLSAAGLIEKQSNSADARSVTIVLTAAGAIAHGKLIDAGVQMVQQATRDLTGGEVELVSAVARRLLRQGGGA